MTLEDTQDEPMNPRSARRHRRAEQQRRRALSPMRILLMVLALPLTTGIIAVGTYIRVNNGDRENALVHLVALAGCDAVQAIGFNTFNEGEPGYHKRNDPDGDGIACEFNKAEPVLSTEPSRTEAPKQRMVGNAKFVRP
ncbi:excalibur calcium-binding domain-containing protein [Ruegeria arenilitoris]|uniref:excalibur calcium-binding domain-containing protein n=1 Tax=Ruegeria arenilitoris TaxID=1173585 RepID=UPI001481C193|nr:excalibur calcium-binding domain-containing protein [Ruegeria arenilitoris]